MGIYPTGALNSPRPWFRYQLDRGSAATGSVTIDNQTGSLQHVALYAVDAAPSGHGFGMAPQDAHRVDAGSWIHLDTPTLSLASSAAQVVDFTLRIPPGASVGPHYAGIVLQPMAPSRNRLNPGLAVITRLGVRVYLTVPGAEHPSLSVDHLRAKRLDGRLTVLAKLRNTGNTLLAPSGTLLLKSPFGSRSIPFDAGRGLQPEDQLTLSIPTELHTSGLLWPYRAQLRVRIGHGMTARSQTIVVWAGSKLVGAGVIASILLVAVTVTHRKQRTNPDSDRN